MDITFRCFTCQKEISIAIAVGHLAQCYRTWCINAGFQPFCTCNRCEGHTTHPEDDDGGQKKRARSAAPPVSIIPEEHTPVREKARTASTSAPRLSLNQLSGMECVLCGQNKRDCNRAVPLLRVGKNVAFLL